MTEQLEIPVAAAEATAAVVPVEVTDATPAPDGAEVFEVDPTTPEGQLIEALLTDIDGYRAHILDFEATLTAAHEVMNDLGRQIDDNAKLAFVFRGGMGRDDLVTLPARLAGQTELVLTGTPKADDLGRWDLYAEPFSFSWEDPSKRPAAMLRCCVTGEGCETVAVDLGYCPHCAGCSREFLMAQGVVMPAEVETE